MQVWTRYLLVLGIVISLHFILQFSHEDYGRATSLTIYTSQLNLKGKAVADLFRGSKSSKAPTRPPEFSTEIEKGWSQNVSSLTDRRANATFVILARNSDLHSVIGSVREIEDRFNRNRGYPYVFLNERPFTEDFKKRVSVLSPSVMEFGVIPHDHWYQPKWIDEEKAKKARDQMTADRVIYGDSVSYRNMCRFNSGFFFKHELLQKYRWYWRVEPNVHFHCNIDYDPFLYMEEHDKIYGFTIALYEYQKTIPTLWGHIRDFMAKHPQYMASDQAMSFMSNDNGESYNLCHFWSNFEIADLDFWRGDAYTAFFEYLDSQGGFYYERWGDAPVHSIAAVLFLPKNRIHFFENIGYEHSPYTHCPKDPETWSRQRCSCDPNRNFDYDGYSCLLQWERVSK